MRYYVYELVRPDGRVFYVGKGSGKRIKDHAKEARRNHYCYKCNLIRSIWKSCNDFSYRKVFETDSEQEAFEHEKKLIAQYGRDNLTNKTDGGEGMGGWEVTQGFRDKHSQIMKERWNKPEYRTKMTNASIELSKQDEWKEKHRIALLTKRNGNGRANEIRWSDPAQHEMLRQKNYERWTNPEEKKKLAERNQREDVRKQLSETRKKQWADPVYRAKMIAARWHN